MEGYRAFWESENPTFRNGDMPPPPLALSKGGGVPNECLATWRVNVMHDSIVLLVVKINDSFFIKIFDDSIPHNYWPIA